MRKIFKIDLKYLMEIFIIYILKIKDNFLCYYRFYYNSLCWKTLFLIKKTNNKKIKEKEENKLLFADYSNQ